ncbi:hypothetical protein [Histophilus somni]|uniref:hypothetical protein n=1 Tax=Histophilus somni TaxID=731 RepID=UPI0018EBE597|nr:hypothetical protein [Histophilus somni]QQF84409.1 hypothetical protein JFL54_01180 [Histophilus somni]
MPLVKIQQRLIKAENGTLQLGDTLQIKAGNIDKPTSDVDGYSSDNIKTSYQSTSKELLIGIKDKPTFKEVKVSGTVEMIVVMGRH